MREQHAPDAILSEGLWPPIANWCAVTERGSVHACAGMCAQFLDGGTVQAVQFLNKVVRTALAEEQHILTVDNPRFIHGTGTVSIV